MGVIAARIDADAATIGLTLGAGTAGGANTTAANSTGAGGLAGAAVFGIGGEVAAAVGSAAILHTDGAVCALADPTPALDRDEITRAHLAARPAVVHVRQEVDADAAAVGKPGLTHRGVALRG